MEKKDLKEFLNDQLDAINTALNGWFEDDLQEEHLLGQVSMIEEIDNKFKLGVFVDKNEQN